MSFYAEYPGKGIGGGGIGVTSLNSLTGALTLAAGTGITITPSGGDTLTIAATGGGGGTPGGTSGQVQYNNAGSFGGFGNWDGTTLAITGAISSTTTLAVGTNLHVFGTSIMAGDMVVQGGANFSGNLGFYGSSEISQPTGNIFTALSNLGLVATPTMALTNLPAQANNTILGNNSGSSASPTALTVAQVNAILPVFTSTLNGIAPLSGGGTTNYLRADGSWASPPGATSGTVTSVSVTSANGLAGTVATATTTPAITLTTSVTGVLKGNGTAISAATSGTDYSSGTSGLTTGILKSTTTTGALTIAVAADFPTLNQNTSGTAANITATSNSTLTTLSALSLPLSQTTGVLPIANGGTNNGSLPVTAGGVVYSDGAKLANTGAGTSTQILQSNGASAPTWAAGGIIAPPTIQKFTSGTAQTYTLPTNPSPTYIRVRMAGGGGGGGGSGTGGTSTVAGTGGTTSFGTTLLSANGGAGGNTASVVVGGLGGTASLGTGPIGIASQGGNGGGGSAVLTTTNSVGGLGAATPFGGAAGGATGDGGQKVGIAAIANTGSGGSGASLAGIVGVSGGGGGAGGYVDAIILSPSSTYTYTVGAGGTAGAAGTTGVAGSIGGSGIIIVEEYYGGATGPQGPSGASGILAVRSVTTTDTATTSDNVLLLSGASFTETLYTAVGNTGKNLEILHRGTSLTQIYTLNTTGGQTIGGIASGSYALYTSGESLTLVSDGANWQILNHRTDTAPTSYSLVIGGSTTAPTPATGSTSTAIWSRRGSYMIFNYQFHQANNTGAANGSGVYLFPLPSGATIDTTTLGWNSGGCTIVGSTKNSISATGAPTGATSAEGQARISDSTHLAINYLSGAAENTADVNSAAYNLGGSAMNYSITAMFPIVGWQP